jgi:hypothetical protein
MHSGGKASVDGGSRQGIGRRPAVTKPGSVGQPITKGGAKSEVKKRGAGPFSGAAKEGFRKETAPGAEAAGPGRG